MVGTTGQIITLTVNSKPTFDGQQPSLPHRRQ